MIGASDGWRASILCLAGVVAVSAQAHGFREKGKPAEVADSPLTVTPPRDWNRLDARPGKHAETWTLDGEQLNDITFFAGIEPGRPLVKERNRKREPLPMVRSGTLLIEVPELLGNTYRAYKQIAVFTVTSTTPVKFLGGDGVLFTYDYLDQDDLPRRGEARATIIAKKLFMMTFDAPRLHYFDRSLPDFRALADSATLKN